MDLLVILLTLIVYLVKIMYVIKIFKGTLYYLVAGSIWIIYAYFITYLSREKYNIDIIQSRRNSNLLMFAFIISSIQIVIYTLSGFIVSFGKNPIQFNSILSFISSMYLIFTELIAFEISRAFLFQSTRKKHMIMAIPIVSVFYSLISFPLYRYQNIATYLDAVKFIGTDFIPKLSSSIFASFLAVLSGPLSSIVFIGLQTLYEWIAPIQPNPEIFVKSLIYTLIPLSGTFFILRETKGTKLFRSGLLERKEVFTKKQDSSDNHWIIFSVIFLILSWGVTGFFGPKASVIASGSMTPALNVGDIIITTPVDSVKIDVGDVIEYKRARNNAPIVHRVIEIEAVDNTLLFTTMGDANNVKDDPVVAPAQVFKMVYVIPKIGWVSIFMKNLIFTLVTYFSKNPIHIVPALFLLYLVNLIYGKTKRYLPFTRRSKGLI